MSGALVKAILYRIFRSTIWGGPREKGFYGGSPGADFCIFLGGIFLGGSKNMKLQDEIGQISISGALVKCKFLS